MPSLHVGVIGGGAAGIVAAKCLLDEGHTVIVFEKSPSVGGVWNYNEGLNADSCTYKSLRTNLPTVVMQLKGPPFPPEVPCYPSHVDVLNYLKNYAAHFHVDEVIRLNSSVTRVYKEDGEKSVWKNVLIIGRGPSGDEISKELAKNGAKSVIVSSEKYGAQSPNGNADQQTQASVDHIEADGTVVLSDGTRLTPDSVDATPQPIPLDADDTRTMKPSIDYIDEGGKVHFINGSYIEAPDVIIFCTGYVYSFGGMLPTGLLFPEAICRRGLDEDLTAEVIAATAAGHVVAPTYKQVFAIEDPTLAFIGLPFDTTTFQCFELQSIWISRVFSGFVKLPSQSDMFADFCDEIRQTKSPLRKNVHSLGLKHFRYFT
ncbi:hypothetical protein BBJ29_001471 [Phytophthora kernoviae]|uniref:Flavin-containing monooxygenase n=1 Tax=Phytophthora kernoviae TaxID=325452 RepID=A0A3F2S5E3_9STRA|nr:hypothetical protein BBJ29_001471 [Phytophthora kernoviae]RLN69912.1 hypothetical protein BBP00_00000067 [Phytophthora kernoviae]